MKRVETLLRAEIGLDAASLGPTAVERAARQRMKTLGVGSVDDYFRLLDSSPAERTELVEAVVVTETWFYRDRDSFIAFTRLAQEWALKNPSGPLRALSVPCSSGEEPYTMAMCLLDAKLPPARFVIDAVDISARTLARAIAGVYGKNSFRGEDLAFRDRHFDAVNNSYTLRQPVRDCVRFRQDNLLNGNFLHESGPYHFIFCRNVLIYFDRPTQVRALAVLNAKLAKDGILFVGPAEMSIFLDNGFVSAGLPMAFACVHRDGTRPTRPQRRARTTVSPVSPPASSPPATLPVGTPPAANGNVPPLPAATIAGVSDASDLNTAQQLADAGKLVEAATLCEEHIRRNGPSAQVYYLLGLVLDAGGNETLAADYYRKALYLAPDHYDALWHMALLLEKTGNHSEANSFKRRAEQRLKAQG
ncbi:MAG TPA: CheR family methyltransferase [Verrucomicrobiota bacterium]|nr:CheR family methyltransferase [Verrucomicrobiota bacterium]